MEVQREDLPQELPDGHRTCLYRVVQEALTNCARHAEAHEIRIALATDDGRLSLTVQDDGRGLAAAVWEAVAEGDEDLLGPGIGERRPGDAHARGVVAAGQTPLDHANPTAGLGLIGIEERVRELGGTLAIRSQAGKGTWLNASIPLPKGADN